MSSKIQLSVTDPCHDNWNEMTSTEQGRFCQSCQKTVTDFSMMSDKEILNHISKRNTDVCGRFSNDQLGRPLIEDYKKKFSWAYIWNFIIAGFMTTGYANAQSKPKPTSKISITNNKGEVSQKTVTVIESETVTFGVVMIMNPVRIDKINGVVYDSKTGLPIPFASVTFKNTDIGLAADSNGVFNLIIQPGIKERVLKASAIGYSPQEYTISRSINKVGIYLEPLADTLEAVVITGNSMGKLTYCNSTETTGLIISTTKVSRTEKAKRLITDWTPDLLKKKEINIYPNPVVSGATVTMALSLKESGDYTTEILDASGRIVYRGQVSMHSNEQNITIPTSATWNKGMYWVRLTGNNSKKLYHSKLILQ